MNWIKCSERLPEINKWVLVYASGEPDEKTITTSCFLTIDIRDRPIWNLLSSGCGCCDSDLTNVTHWMPLPEPPKD